MASLTEILDYLNADELRHIVDSFEFECEDRRKVALLKRSILRGGEDPSDILSALTVDELKWIAEELELSTSGRKAVLIQRLLSDDSDFEIEAEETVSSSDETVAPRNSRPKASEAVPDAPPVLSPTRTDVDLSIFRAWLQGALNTGRVQEGQINFSFCPACSRKHPRRWFNYVESTRSFYLCYAGNPVIVESLEVGAKFTTHPPTAYVKANELNDAFTSEIARVEALADGQQATLTSEAVSEAAEALVVAAESAPERSFLSRIFGSGVQTGGHLVRHVRVSSITSTPPFVELKIDMEHVHAAIQKGKDSWNS